MDVNEEGLANVTEARAVHPLNMNCPIEVTLDGIVTEVRAVPEKAPLPMEVTPVGIVTEVSLLHCWKALCPIEVKEEGLANVTEARAVPEKAYCPKEVTVEGILIDLSVAQP